MYLIVERYHNLELRLFQGLDLTHLRMKIKMVQIYKNKEDIK